MPKIFDDVVDEVCDYVKNHTPELLIAGGIGLSIAAPILSAAGMRKYDKIVADIRRRDPDGTVPFKIKLLCFLPATIAEIGAVACTLSAGKIYSKRNAALTLSAIATEKIFAEYREKVKDELGEKKENEIRDRVAESQMIKAGSNQVIFANTDSNALFTCYDAYTNIKFKANRMMIDRAVVELNRLVLEQEEATLMDFYDLLGVNLRELNAYNGGSDGSIFSETGWTIRDGRLDFYLTSVLENNEPCIVLNYYTPSRPHPLINM